MVFQVKRHTMIVAVAALRPSASLTPSFPPQQSPMFGHRASSHTVCRPRPRRSFLILEKEAPVGILVLRYDGSLGLQWRSLDPPASMLSGQHSRFSVSQYYAVGHLVRYEVVQRRTLGESLTKGGFGGRRSSQTPYLRPHCAGCAHRS